jgi:hypothetical protein
MATRYRVVGNEWYIDRAIHTRYKVLVVNLVK